MLLFFVDHFLMMLDAVTLHDHLLYFFRCGFGDCKMNVAVTGTTNICKRNMASFSYFYCFHLHYCQSNTKQSTKNLTKEKNLPSRNSTLTYVVAWKADPKFCPCRSSIGEKPVPYWYKYL